MKALDKRQKNKFQTSDGLINTFLENLNTLIASLTEQELNTPLISQTMRRKKKLTGKETRISGMS